MKNQGVIILGISGDVRDERDVCDFPWHFTGSFRKITVFHDLSPSLSHCLYITNSGSKKSSLNSSVKSFYVNVRTGS